MGPTQMTPQTTYTEKIDGSAKLSSGQKTTRVSNTELAQKHRRTNITLGNDGTTDVTEFKEAFTKPVTRNQNSTQTQDLVKEMKTPHFSFA
jgi:hypothetical protein